MSLIVILVLCALATQSVLCNGNDPPYLNAPYPHAGLKKSAAESLRSFNAPRPETRAAIRQQTKDNEKLFSRLGNEDLVRALKELDLFERMTVDPICTQNINCEDNANRQFVDGREFATLNGQCNNLANFSWGMTGTQHRRIAPNAYADEIGKPREKSVTSTEDKMVFLPTARRVSEAIHRRDTDKTEDDNGRSLALFYFMQFIDHDIAKTPEGEVPAGENCCNSTNKFCSVLPIEDGDSHFNKDYCMATRRSLTVVGCGSGDKFQNQLNDLTVFLDASMVYGSSVAEMNELRSFHAGYLKTSTANFMPPAEHPEEQACRVEDPDICFLAGDTRADVHPGLTTFHTIFMREHNRIASALGRINPKWSDDRLFFETRRIIAALIQRIVFNEMLPRILDETIMNKFKLSEPYRYNSNADPSLIQAFSLAYRYHHLMPSALRRARQDGLKVTNLDPINQEQVFMQPDYLLDDNYRGIDDIGIGLTSIGCPFTDRTVNNAARNLLFLDDNGNSFDLAALNINRGRDWGTPDYTVYRSLCGVGTVTSWDDLKSTHSEDVIEKLKTVYADPRDIDLWTGLMTEKPVGTSISGPTHSCLVATQFLLVRDGDRLWHENTNQELRFTSAQLTEIQKVKLSSVLCNSLDVVGMRAEVFDINSSLLPCGRFSQIDLNVWSDSNAQ